MTVAVRKAGLSDLSELVAWGKGSHARSNYAEIAPYNAVITRQFFKGAMMDANHAFFVALNGGKVCGLLVGHCDNYPFSHVRFATDVLFVADAGGGQLLDAFVEWARKARVAVVESAPSQTERFDILADMFERKGFIRCGGTFRKDLRMQSMTGVAA